MTVETFPQFAQIEIETIGPHEIPFPYEEGSIRCYVIADGRHIALTDDDFTPSPASSTTLGTLYLSINAFDDHFGRVLVIARETLEEQAWLGVMGGREKGLERQLDRLMMRMQELGRHVAGSVRVFGSADPVVAVPNAAIVFDANGKPISGPDVEDLIHAEENSAAATEAALRAEQAAAVAEQWAAIPRAGASNFATMGDFRAYLDKFDIWAVGDTVTVGSRVIEKKAIGWVDVTPSELPNALVNAPGGVGLSNLPELSGQSVLGNVKPFPARPAPTPIVDLAIAMGFGADIDEDGRYLFPELSGGNRFQLKWGSVPGNASGLTSIVFDPPFAVACRFLLPFVLSTDGTPVSVAYGNRTAAGASVDALEWNGSAWVRTTKTIRYLAGGF